MSHDLVERWNLAREAFSDRLGDDVFVPSIMFAAGDDADGNARTYITWVDGSPARVPRVDIIVTPRKPVAWSAIEDVIAGAPRSDEIAPHFVVDGELAVRVFEAIERAPALGPVRGVPEPAARAAANEERANELMLKAQMARYQGKRKDAIRLMREATALSPRADYLRELAMVAHEADEHVTAFEVASRAFAMEPDLMAALLGAINGAYAARFEEALQLAERVREMSPDDRNAHVIRASCLTDLARYDEAIAAADEALAMDHEPMVENMKAYALAAAGRADEARAAYEHALAALDAALSGDSDEKADLHSRRAWSLLGLGRAKEALAAAKEALKLEKGAFLAMQSQGRALVALGKQKEALAVLERAIRSRHAAPMASFHAAEAHAALGDEAAAAKALRAACASPHFERLARRDPALAKLVDDPRGHEQTAAKTSAKTTAKKKAGARTKR